MVASQLGFGSTRRQGQRLRRLHGASRLGDLRHFGAARAAGRGDEFLDIEAGPVLQHEVDGARQFVGEDRVAAKLPMRRFQLLGVGAQQRVVAFADARRFATAVLFRSLSAGSGSQSWRNSRKCSELYRLANFAAQGIV